VGTHFNNPHFFNASRLHGPTHVNLPGIGDVWTLINLRHHILTDGKTKTTFLKSETESFAGCNWQTFRPDEFESQEGINLALD